MKIIPGNLYRFNGPDGFYLRIKEHIKSNILKFGNQILTPGVIFLVLEKVESKLFLSHLGKLSLYPYVGNYKILYYDKIYNIRNIDLSDLDIECLG